MKMSSQVLATDPPPLSPFMTRAKNLQSGGREIGELNEGVYTFIGLGLDEDCYPVFVGCSVETIGSSNAVAISMTPTEDVISFCGLIGYCTSDVRCEGLL